jgi:hypothetical protein
VDESGFVGRKRSKWRKCIRCKSRVSTFSGRTLADRARGVASRINAPSATAGTSSDRSETSRSGAGAAPNASTDAEIFPISPPKSYPKADSKKQSFADSESGFETIAKTLCDAHPDAQAVNH